MNRAFAIAFLMSLAVASACKRTPQPLTESVVTPIEQVVANPKAFDRRVITIQACYVSTFERATLEPCDNPSHHQMVWIEDAEMLYESQRIGPMIPDPTPLELRQDRAPMFLFHYNEARSRAAWQKLNPATRGEDYRSFVKAIGQFETIAPNQPEPMKRGYGHLNAFSHRLILFDVLESKPL